MFPDVSSAPAARIAGSGEERVPGWSSGCGAGPARPVTDGTGLGSAGSLSSLPVTPTCAGGPRVPQQCPPGRPRRGFRGAPAPPGPLSPAQAARNLPAPRAGRRHVEAERGASRYGPRRGSNTAAPPERGRVELGKNPINQPLAPTKPINSVNCCLGTETAKLRLNQDCEAD